MPTDLTPQDMRGMALDINNHFRGQKIHFIGVDWSGEREMKKFLEALRFYTTSDFTLSTGKVGMSADLDERFREFRPVSGLENQNVADDVDAYVAFENRTSDNGGISAASGPVCIAYSIHEKKLPGKEGVKIYLAIVEDVVGIGNFIAKGGFEKYIGFRTFLYKRMRNTHGDLQEKGLLPYFSDKEPARHYVTLIPSAVEALHEVVERASRIFLI
jgi:hypothetical protein